MSPAARQPARATARAAQITADDHHYLGDRTDVRDLDDVHLAAELRTGEAQQDSAWDALRSQGQAVSPGEYIDRARADAAWARRAAAIRRELAARERRQLDADTPPGRRELAIHLRALHAGEDPPPPGHPQHDPPTAWLTWDHLSTTDARGWAAVAAYVRRAALNARAEAAAAATHATLGTVPGAEPRA